MAFFRRSDKGNYDLWSGHAWYVPGVSGMFMMLLMLIAGGLLGNIVTAVMVAALGQDLGMEYGMLVAYPVMFIPPIIYAGSQSSRNMTFETGYELDSKNFAPLSGWFLALLCAIGTMALAFCMDAVNEQMPPMPEWLEQMLGSMTTGKFWVNFLSVSIMAPIFEEWLVRGIVLRGLLNYKKKDGTTMAPALAIVVSALYFAVIHANPWQAVPAFALGCLFGYVYWKTGSLKLTMLMHFTNNTLALALGQIDSLSEYDNWMDVLGPAAYWAIFAAGILFLVFFFMEFRKITLPRPQGGSTEIPTEETSF